MGGEWEWGLNAYPAGKVVAVLTLDGYVFGAFER
jgi:hypothetical protein